MRLEQLHYLIELHKTRSFSKASEALYITQPSLSIAISSLETELGVQLFERTRSGVFPTPIGEEIIKVAHELVLCQNKIIDLAQQNNDAPQKLSIISIPAVSYGVLTEVIRNFQHQHANIAVSLQEYSPTTIISDYLTLLSDTPGLICICAIPPITSHVVLEALEEQDIGAKKLFEDQMSCFLSADHPLASGNAIAVEEVMSIPLIDLNLLTKKSPPSFYSESMEIGLGKDYRRLRKNIHVEVWTLANLKRLVIDSQSTCIMPRLIIYRDKDYLEGRIKVLPVTNTQMDLDYYMLYSKKFPLKPIEKSFMEAIIAGFHDIDFDNPSSTQKNTFATS